MTAEATGPACAARAAALLALCGLGLAVALLLLAAAAYPGGHEWDFWDAAVRAFIEQLPLKDEPDTWR